MISNSDTKVGTVVCDGVEFFVLITFRKSFNDEAIRLNVESFDKHVKRNVANAYKLAKELAVDVPKHCSQFLKTSIEFREPLCANFAHQVREVESKLNSHPIKQGFKLRNTALFKLLTAQAAFERGHSSKRAADSNLEDVSASEAEGTPRKLSKSDSVISTLDTLLEERDSDDEFEEAEMSLTLPGDQTTVIDNQESAKQEPIQQESVITTELETETKPTNHTTFGPLYRRMSYANTSSQTGRKVL